MNSINGEEEPPVNPANHLLMLEMVKKSDGLQQFLLEQHIESERERKELQTKLLEQQEKLLEQDKKHHQEIMVLKQQMVVQNHANTINNNTTNNNQFNLQFFLNEQCKDALNLVDFIESLQVQVSDLEATGRLGHVEGISRIFVNGLRQLDLYKRPIHCTDFKRETLYVKDQNSWEKDNVDKAILKQAVKKVANKNIKQISTWREQHPEFQKSDTKLNDEFIQLSLTALGGRDEVEAEKYSEKIIKNVLKEVILDKTIHK
jgi:hypothetical protein